jgi:hypothetical protein
MTRTVEPQFVTVAALGTLCMNMKSRKNLVGTFVASKFSGELIGHAVLV